MNKNKAEFTDILLYVVLGIVIVMISVAAIWKSGRVNRSETQTVSCEIIDKYQQRYSRYQSVTYYFIVNGKDVFQEEAVKCSKEDYQHFHIGDTIFVNVQYDQIGIIDIEFQGGLQ